MLRLTFMAFAFGIRDLFRPPTKILQRVGIGPGMTVLDFGCGPGGFSIAAAMLTGQQGHVYALDRDPVALRSVKTKADRKGLHNIETIGPEEIHLIADRSIDVVLLYDVLHELDDIEPVLKDMRRVLKDQGVLSVDDHHLSDDVILSKVGTGGLFRCCGRIGRTIHFAPANRSRG
ncbi:MAG: class I SAM-dependent methyltransferase [Sedimentisphaerales bacterium]|jgi:ubiquinone/menaquinone biosynthesis C-methylase UbiE|nr:class I SAM-dependent methyltransferase [Sedimentisphaerales bacterium]